MLKFLFAIHKSSSSVKCNEFQISSLCQNTALKTTVLFLCGCVLTIYKQIFALHWALQFMFFSKESWIYLHGKIFIEPFLALPKLTNVSIKKSRPWKMKDNFSSSSCCVLLLLPLCSAYTFLYMFSDACFPPSSLLLSKFMHELM